MSYSTQCTYTILGAWGSGASGSSTISAKLFVPAGAPVHASFDPLLIELLTVNAWLLAWRVLMRAAFTTSAYGLAEGLRSIPRLVVGNVIAMLAAARALSLHLGGSATKWDKTQHVFPAELPR